MRSGFRTFLCTLLLCVLAGIPVVARASHLRGTSVSWAPTATSGTVQFTVLYSQAIYGTPPATVSFNFNFGDGQSSYVTANVTSVNTAESYLTATAVFTHTYTSPGPFIAYYQDCCRVDTFTVGSSTTIRMETLVNPMANPVNHPPTAVSPAIITVPMQSTATFQIFAIDQDNDRLRYRLSTPSEQYGSGATATCNTQPPPGISVANSGIVTWDLSQITAAGCNYPAPAVGQLWPVQVMIEDLDSNGDVKSRVPVDVLLKLVNITQPPPTLSFTPSGVISASAGVPVTFTAMASNTTSGSRITLNAVGLPTGAAATNLNQTLTQPLSSVFTWTPTQSQLGTYVIVYSATNDTYEQTTGSVSIKVLNVQPPALTCASATQAQYGIAKSFPLTVSDPQGDAVSVIWSVDGSTVQTDNVPATSGATNLSLQQAFNSIGSHTVSVSATNTENQTSSCSVPVSVSAAEQTISFSALPNLTYGDAAVALTATASSGLPVSYTATGSCSVTGSALEATGVGPCTVTATQAGSTNYNPAAAVVLSTVTQPRLLTVSASDATRVYGSANPAFTGTVSGTLNGDSIQVTYVTSATAASPVGSYVITPSVSGSALGNYTVSASTGMLTVTPATLTVTANNATRPYGSANPSFSGSVSGARNGDAFSATYTTTATVTSSVGTYAITPAVSGPALNNYTVNPVPGTLTVVKGAVSGVQLLSSASSVFVQTSVTFQATVAGPGGSPTGSISFTDGTTTLATVPLANGVAQMSNASLASGTHTIVAIYSGDGNDNGASSAPITQQVADISLQFSLDALGSSTQTILPGGTAAFTMTVAPVGLNVLPADVQLSVAGLPTGATYAFSKPTVAKGSASTQVVLTVTAPPATAELTTPSLGRRLAPAALAVLLLPFAGRMRRRSSLLARLLTVVVLLCGSLAALTGLSGCGSQNGFLTQAQQTYTVTVTASASSVSRSTTAQLIVQ